MDVNDQAVDEIDFRHYLDVLRGQLWLLLVASVVAGVAAFVVSNWFITPIYQASTVLLVTQASTASASDYNSVLANTRLAQTFSQMVATQPVLSEVIKRLDLKMSYQGLENSVHVQLMRDTQLIEVRVDHGDPKQAALIANTIAKVFAEQSQTLQTTRYTESKDSLAAQLATLDTQIKDTSSDIKALGTSTANKDRREQLQAELNRYQQSYTALLQSYEQVRLAEAQSTSSIIQIEPAVAPNNPIQPRTLINTLVAAAVGLFLSMVFVLIREGLSDSIKGPDEITRQLKVFVLGQIPHFNSKDTSLVVAAQPRSVGAEAFRTLRTNIQFSGHETPLQTFLITSTSPREGKSAVSANLALAFGQGGYRVILIDADMRRPSVHKHMQVANQNGLSDLFLQSKLNPSAYILETQFPGVLTLTSGSLPPNPAELIGSARMGLILDYFRQHFDIVIFDTPPVMAVTDAVVLAPHIDATVMLIKPSVAKLPATKRALQQLQRAGATVIGAVVNDLNPKDSRYVSAYDDYYNDSPAKPGKKDDPKPILGTSTKK